ncbi:hypothetical protein HXX76_011626 [Chlamydomonas incerta]|uniref:Uncharacterized protein n=1 Tax=Chlamydomonas incerta TaxID=51695 RepID=A0A835SUH3_CHLIN|nr:hypothetical protein HXX76_011626 [Chlamydomonas incerta]|eukprot:KAG2428509.1 hypothetical protein HXX76_011626 [Chlamydomonas incerta]
MLAPVNGDPRCTVLQHVSHLAEQAVEVAEQPVATAVETAVGGAQAAQGAVTGFFTNVLAYFAALVARIQATLVQLLSSFRRSEQIKLRSGAQAGAAATGGARTPVAFVAPSSGTARAAAGGSSRQQQHVMLLPGQNSAFGQLGVAGPVLAVSAAAAALYAGSIMWQRWRAGVERKREVRQYAAMQEPALARQKQRFQRALVVDSVNLELPAIKEMDIQPGPVQVEKIISRQPGAKPPPGAAAAASAGPKQPAMDTDSLRQWRQFMASSRTTEVKDDLRGGAQGGRAGSSGRAAAQQAAANLAPHGALGDAALKDLSERIRRAGEGAPPEEAPVVTFEQLYANSRESDEEAMARRAAERKARWQQQQQNPQQKQQLGGSGPAQHAGAAAGAPGRVGGAAPWPGPPGAGIMSPGAAAPGSMHAAARQPQAPLPRSAPAAAPSAPPAKEPLPVAAKDELTASLAARTVLDSHPRPSAPAPGTTVGSSNPFAVGLFGDAGSPQSGAAQLSSSGKVAPRPEPQVVPRGKAAASATAPAPAPAAGPAAAGSNDNSVGTSRPVNSRLEVSLGRGARASPSAPPVQAPKEAAQPSALAAAKPAPPAAPTVAAPAVPVPARAPPAELSAALSQDLEEVVVAPAASISTSSAGGSSSSAGTSTASTSSAQPVQSPGRRAPEVGVLALALAGLAKEQLVTSLGSGSNSSSRDEDEGGEGGARRGRRAAVGGPLRTPDTQAPGLTRLMRRPTSSPPPSSPVKQDTAAVL